MIESYIMGFRNCRVAPLLAAILCAPAASADEINGGDTAWILTATALVLMMTLPGLALFYAGLVRARNSVSVVAQCFGVACITSLLWVICGYSLAFADGNAFIGGLGKAMLRGVSRESVSGTIPETVFAAFQMTFAIITPALIVGAFVERMRFAAVLLFSGLWLLLVYAPVAHWIWGGGWLAERGVLDFAGGVVVHTTAGIAALVVAVQLGARRTFQKQFYPPHSPVIVGIGAALLWVGWFGFNAGSALAANGDAGMALLATHTAAAAGALVWAGLEWRSVGKPSLVALVTGLIAGLATITPAAGFVGLPGALLLGAAGGLLCYYIVPLIRARLSIDDSLDVFAVHGVGGITGSLLAAVLASESLGGVGLPEGATAVSQFGVQLMAVLAAAVWTAVASFLILRAIQIFVPLRAEEEMESEGLDLAEHGEKGYHLE
ncbi:MAG: ammonium transporter [Gammaproteobacteria bacterium]